MHKIIFSGKILPGHDPAKVCDKLLALLGLREEQLEQLFSGKTHVLKKGLNAVEAERYMEYMTKRGISVEIEPPLKKALEPFLNEPQVDARPPKVEPASPFPTLIFDAEPQTSAEKSLISPVSPGVKPEEAGGKVRRPAFKAPSRPWAKTRK